MGDGTKEKPLTREDVLRLIKENGNTAEGLDLSNRKFQDNVDLSDLNLSGIKLNFARLFRANFDGSSLDSAELLGAKLQHATFNPLESKDAEPKNASLQMVGLGDADLTNAEFRQANLAAARFQEQQQTTLPTGESLILSSPAFLHGTDFRGANLFLANFKGCYFYGTKFEGACIRGADIYEAHLEEADWGSTYKIGEEIKKDFYSAESIYRRLKQWYTNAGMYDIAGEFFFREMTAQRNRIKWRPQPWHRAWSKFVSLICGYGERPFRVVASGAVVVFGLAAVYYLLGGLTLPYSLYYSAVSFTALGYGSWAFRPPEDWVQAVGAAESFIGVFMIALFLITFTRKMRR